MKIKTFLASSYIILASLLPNTSNQQLSAFDWDGLCDPIICDVCSPYDECRWSISLLSGASPTYFLGDNDDLLFFNPPIVVTSPLEAESRSFHNQYNLPWNAGVELGYMFFDNCEIFLDFTYNTSKTREDNRFIGDVTGNIFLLTATHYRSYDYHIGSRYYFDTFCCVFTPFIGGKIGITNRDGVLISENIVSPAGTSITYCGIPRFCKTTTFSGGFHVGVNWDLTCCLAVTFKAEALVSGQWDSPIIRAPNPNPFGLPTVVLGRTGSIIEVPITLGLRYNF